MMKRLSRLIAVGLTCLQLAQPALASQATLVTPGSPLSMISLASFLNNALLSIGSCNSGNSAPANGPGPAAFPGECWINTTANPWVFSYTADGTHWSQFGALNTSTFVWTPYFGGSPIAETAPIAGSLASGVLTLSLLTDANFTVNGSNQLAFANIAAGSLLANGTGSSAEPTATTPNAWLNQWCSGTQFNFPQRGASSWACGTVSALLVAGTGINLTGTGQVTIALANQIAAGGPIGTASAIPQITYNAQGQLTAVTTVAVNPFAQISAPTSNAIYKGQGSSAPVASALSDNGTIVSSSESIDIASNAAIQEFANNGSTATVLNKLAIFTGAPSTATVALTTSTSGVAGIVVGNAGTAGNAQIAIAGQASCIFDGVTTAGDYVQASTTSAGECHDVGSTYPTSNQVIGRVLSTHGAGGTFAIEVFGPEINAAAGGGGGLSSVDIINGNGLSETGTCNSTTSINCTVAITAPVSAANGGSGVVSPTAHTVPINEGASAQNNTGTGTLNQTLVSGGASADPTFKSGARLLLETLTGTGPSVSTTVSWSGFNSIEIEFDVVPITSGTNFLLQVSNGTLLTSGYSGNSLIGSTTAAAGQTAPTTAFLLCNNNSGGVVAGITRLLNIGSASTKKQISQAWSGNFVELNSGTSSNTGTLIGGTFSFSSGNISSSTIRIYGIM